MIYMSHRNVQLSILSHIGRLFTVGGIQFSFSKKILIVLFELIRICLKYGVKYGLNIRPSKNENKINMNFFLNLFCIKEIYI